MRRSGPGRLAALAVLAAAACAHPSGRPRGEEREAPAAEVGLASFYARSLQGNPTASGVPYDGRSMTCAHRTHPFGSVLRVTDLDSGRSVVVRVVDRGPFVRGRIVDLSYAAAKALGIVERGVARVRVERLE